MLRDRTTLVLGAGASLAMGYPTGAGLRAEILDLTAPECQQFAIVAGLCVPDMAALCKFVDAFRMSQMYSIDAFLARRPEFAEIGKRAIAAVLLKREQSSVLDRCTHEDGWMQYLWNKFGSDSWEELDFSCLRIVTFNYDRSLEHYLLQAIRHSHGVDQSLALEKLRGLKVVHVYGSLSAPLPDRGEYLRYGIGVEDGAPAIAARSLQVIPEGRDDSEVMERAREYLAWADQIAFMGFGFDATNMKRLDTNRSCLREADRAGGTVYRRIVATGYGLTTAEVEAASALIGNNAQGHGRPSFHNTNCLMMLRESGLLQ